MDNVLGSFSIDAVKLATPTLLYVPCNSAGTSNRYILTLGAVSKPSSRSITSAAKDVLTPNTAIAEVTRICFNNFLFIHAPVRLNYNVIYSTIVPCSSISLTKSFPCSHTVASF